MGCGGSTPAAADAPKASGLKEVDKKGAGLADLSSIPASTGALDVSDGGTKTLEGVGKLTKLVKLDANSNALAAVPAEIGQCESLEELLVYANALTALPDEVGSLAELTTLNAFNNKIKKLPATLGKLTKLEEANFAANKLMAITSDATFAGWAGVKVLGLYDNNLVRMASLAPLVALQELRISGNNLEEMPTLSSHPGLTVFEIHKNRIASIADDYFSATPALERLSIWGNQLTTLPSSLCGCSKLLGVQAQENKLTSLPAASWPTTMETVFLQGNTGLAALPPSFGSLPALKRVNLTGLVLDDASSSVANQMKGTCLKSSDGIFWGTDGKKMS